MRAVYVILAFAMLMGCTRAAEKAEQEYEFLKKNGGASKTELCAAATKTRDAWKERGDNHKYLVWQVYASNECDY